jgi:hypothetical protein
MLITMFVKKCQESARKMSLIRITVQIVGTSAFGPAAQGSEHRRDVGLVSRRPLLAARGKQLRCSQRRASY